MTSQICHSQYIKHVIEHIQHNSQTILNTILSIIHALVQDDQLDTTILVSRSGICRYTPRNFIQDITNLHNFLTEYTRRDLKIIQLCDSYTSFAATFPYWFSYRSRKQSRENIERYGMQLIRQLYFFKHLGNYMFHLIFFRRLIKDYMCLSEHEQKIDQSKRKNKEYIIRHKTVSDFNYFYNVINQEYQKYIKNLLLPINPSKSRSDMVKMESFFKDLGHLKQTSRKIKDIITDNYPIVDNVETSLAKFIQSPQQQKGDREMICHLVTLLSISIAKQT